MFEGIEKIIINIDKNRPIEKVNNKNFSTNLVSEKEKKKRGESCQKDANWKKTQTQC